MAAFSFLGVTARAPRLRLLSFSGFGLRRRLPRLREHATGHPGRSWDVQQRKQRRSHVEVAALGDVHPLANTWPPQHQQPPWVMVALLWRRCVHGEQLVNIVSVGIRVRRTIEIITRLARLRQSLGGYR